MPNPFRFAVWSAVSTKPQAEGWDKSDEEKDTNDRSSLPEQEKTCRAAGLAKGWRETSGPYIVPGESRTRWVNLRDAEREIPALHAMLEDGKRGLYDILALYDYNRLRDLLDPVAKTLASYGIQIYSVSQPVEPIITEEFTPYTSDGESMMRGLSQIISRAQISDLRRKYRYGVSARVRNGLPSNRIPYGYAKPPGQHDSKAVPVQVPAQARVVIQIKEMFLAGATYYDIKNYLKANGILSPQGAEEWSHTTIKKILHNPFYAGKVFFGRSRVVHDPNRNTTRLAVNPNPLIAEGRHQPLYSWEDHLAILAEMDRREDFGHNNRYAFSSLLKCSTCGATLHHDHGIWRCHPQDHISLPMDMALALIPRVLQKVLYDTAPPGASAGASVRPSDDSRRQNLERQRGRVQAAYESEVYSLEEAETKIKAIDVQLHKLKDDEVNHLQRQIGREQFLATLKHARGLLAILPTWVKEDDPKRINLLLLRLCKEIVVTPDLQMTVRFRE